MASWVEMGDSATGTGVSRIPAGANLSGARLALTPEGRPVVSWSDTGAGNEEVHLRVWSGSTWLDLGGSGTGGGVSSDAERSMVGGLAIDTDGRICQAWRADEPRRLRLRCWDGTAWRGLAGSEVEIATPGNPWWPAVTFIGGQPAVAFEDYGGGTGAYVRRFDGTTWTWLGPSSTPGLGPGRLVNLRATAVSDAVVSWVDDAAEVHASHWNGATWTELGGSSGVSQSAATSARPQLALGDRPYVSWLEGDTDVALHLRAWDGAAWVELGGSASGAGVSAGHADVQGADLAVTADGRPVVAFSAGGDIHVVAWDGAAWLPIGAQDAGGISGTGQATWPTLEIAASGAVFVAWNQDLADGQQVYLRALDAGW